MKIVELLNIKKALMPQAQKKLPVALSYKLFKLIQRAEQEEPFYKEKLRSILNEYAAHDEKGNIAIDEKGVFITEDNKDAFTEKMKELNDIEVDGVDVQFTLDELSPLELSIEDMAALSKIIKEG
jgi:hypothetical protein